MNNKITDFQVIDRLKSIYDNQKTDNIIDDNKLDLIFKTCSQKHKYIVNKLKTKKLQQALLEISCLFDKNHINYITFKGVVLANRLYEDIGVRIFSDIDIYVPESQFDEALKVLSENGYSLLSKYELLNEHHAILFNSYIKLELHRNILSPQIEIDETYLRNHTEKYIIENAGITTFDTTATLLHLIYHLYMDLSLYVNDHSMLIEGEWLKAPRLLARLYEIALFVEKYSDDIVWQDIIDDLHSQKLRIHIKVLLWDMLRMFPDVLPEIFVNEIEQLECYEHPNDNLYMKVLKYHYEDGCDNEECLRRLIDLNWKTEHINGSYTFEQKEFVTAKTFLKSNGDEKNVECKCSVNNISNGISFEFYIKGNDVYFSEDGNFDVQATSGVHIFIRATKEYYYSSTFLFPKNVNNKIVVIPYDVLKNEIIPETGAAATFEKTEDGYIIKAVLTDKYLNHNAMLPYFYLQLVVPVCDKKTGKHETNLISCKNEDMWNNPIHYVKIVL